MKSAAGGRRSAVVIAVCMLAFGLRAYHLGTQSLWYDEGLSVYLAAQAPQDTLALSAITDHPPLHALMLGAWMQAAGYGGAAGREVAVRFVSLWWSVLAVALTWRVGRELLTDSIGALGALLMATSAFAVWYAQEARGYSLLLALTLIATWAFVRACGKPSSLASRPRRTWGTWLAFILAGIAALYTHYYAAFTLLALNAAFLAVLACKRQAPSRITHDASRFYLAQLAIVLGFAPWLPAAIQQAAANVSFFPGRVGWQTVVNDTLRAFATGDPTPTNTASVAMIVMTVLALMGAFVEQRRTTRLNRVIAVLLVAVPMAAMACIAWQKPKFAPRYLIEALPAFYLLVSAGALASDRQRLSGWAARVWRMVVSAGAIVLIVTGALALQATCTPDRQRPDVRGVADYIHTNEQAGDVIVLLSGHQWPAFEFYYRGLNRIAPMPEGVMPPAQTPLDYRAAAQLEDTARGHSRLWLVLWQNELADPTDVVTSELLTKSKRLSVGRDFHEMRLLLFDLQGHAPFGGGPHQKVEARFAEPISLAGYDLHAAERKPGESVELALYWRASGQIERNYQVFTHLLAPDGKLASGSDHIAGADSYPTSLWTAGTLIRNTFALQVPPAAPPGEYAIEIGLYSGPNRLRLTEGSDHFLLPDKVVVK